eukprot:CAMPEP_0177579318 /NCGR_PEP_ID=MMETSP0419_2-20121207/883_1 /TAXON_ID=582737 /ORGANISM="Tetraselmis sp., Strain GSL018" /LENGTH=127 /DNA_ID=CAMNT_0019067951 /DNA_START=624 /DNA_END=1004 /DNA_ORIENTATION=-
MGCTALVAALLLCFAVLCFVSGGVSSVPGKVQPEVKTSPGTLENSTGCVDSATDCFTRVSALHGGSCPEDLERQCKGSCGACPADAAQADSAACEDESDQCEELAAESDCLEVADQCKKTCGLCDAE